jgi:hypothetical protein
VLTLALLLAVAAGRLAAWRVADPYSRYYTGKAVHSLSGWWRSWSWRSSGGRSPAHRGGAGPWPRPGGLHHAGGHRRPGRLRQGPPATGRIVAVSNKATFTEPVHNYSVVFESIWEELTVPIAYRSDWRTAEQILHQEAVGRVWDRLHAAGIEIASETAEGTVRPARPRARPLPVPSIPPRSSVPPEDVAVR